ncbi:adenylylsulfate kinase [Acidaminobacter sp. JC074]|uniref:adenylylsulfate kinase n=1 Tax=Acidaminobacter sp. JC074 TaxID=2530199 RepID=UPI001F0D3E35|nr:adenylylsulfate kinase [Acidaminobacter sp. JC074]MCH4889626.1 adenylylsulfate kinase [Acidaminobacter sp. JC074]
MERQVENNVINNPVNIHQVCDVQFAISSKIVKSIKLELNSKGKLVVNIHGSSGSGKSGVAALVADRLNAFGIKTCLLNGDHYPRRIPIVNDAERLRVYREAGMTGLIDASLYSEKVQQILNHLMHDHQDANPDLSEKFKWIKIYQMSGRKALESYLGTSYEQDFHRVNQIIKGFKEGDRDVYLKHMGTSINDISFHKVSFEKTEVLILEWTHGNSQYLKGIDMSVLLHVTPKESLKNRLKRNRDSFIGSPFTDMVIDIERDQIYTELYKCHLIFDQVGNALSLKDVSLNRRAYG